MADQTKTLTGKDGRTYEVPAEVTQQMLDEFVASQSKSSSTWDKAKEFGSQLLDKTVETLPQIGGVVGGLAGGALATPETLGAGTIPGAIGGAAVGGAGGAYVRDAINQLRSGTRQSLGQAAQNQLTEGANQASAAMIPIGLKLRAPAMRETAQDTLQNALGDTSTRGPETSRTLLQRGLGRLKPTNTSEFGRQVAAEDVTGRATYRASTTGGQPTLVKAGEVTRSQNWPAYYTHKAATDAAQHPSVSENALQTVRNVVASPGVRAAGAQGLWNAAQNADPIGQMMRFALMQLLSGNAPPGPK